jgi:hypothetical protein
VDDRSTHNREFKDGYLNFINTISRNNKKDFITFDPDLHTVNRLWGYTRTAVEIKLNNDALSNMIDCGEDRVWAALSRVTGKSVDYWRSQAGYRDYQNRPYGCFYTPQRRLALKTRFFIRQLKKARKKKNLSQKMRHVVRAFRNAIFISGSTYEPTLLSALLPLLGNNNVFMKALVTMPESRELIFPAQAPLYLEWGIKPEQVYPVFHFIFDDPAEIYHIF